jgi:hypothetical protein
MCAAPYLISNDYVSRLPSPFRSYGATDTGVVCSSRVTVINPHKSFKFVNDGQTPAVEEEVEVSFQGDCNNVAPLCLVP